MREKRDIASASPPGTLSEPARGTRELMQPRCHSDCTRAKAPPLLLDALVEDERLSVRLTPSKEPPGPSKLGNFHYIPVLVHEAERPAQPQRTLLELCGVLLGPLQGRMPWLWRPAAWPGWSSHEDHAPSRRQTALAVAPGNTGHPGRHAPPLILNRHCQICEFRQRCQEEAVQRTTSAWSVDGRERDCQVHRRGIFTVTQLSCTFRPRKRWKALPHKVQPYQAALKALAIRDKKNLCLWHPRAATLPYPHLFDLEGDPDPQFVYLLGMIVQSGTKRNATRSGPIPRLVSASCTSNSSMSSCATRISALCLWKL